MPNFGTVVWDCNTECGARYKEDDVHMTVKITQLEKAFEEIKAWCDDLQKKGFK